MKIQTFSVVVGGDACNAQCPYCVSKLTGSKNGLKEGQKPMEINRRNFNIACNFAKQSGVSTVLLTGKGEPLLYHNHISRYLEMLEKWQFPFIELQTNGILLHSQTTNPFFTDNLLKNWYAAGLTTVSLSCVHFMPAPNMEIFGQDIHLLSNVARLHDLGFSVRISCVGVAGMIDDTHTVLAFVEWCRKHQVEQFTWRPATNIPEKDTVNNPVKKGVHEWINLNGVDEKNVKAITDWFDYEKNATLLLELAHGAKVYDCYGQNISLNSCLTHRPNPDDIRQLIFSSDGHLRYSWTKKGAIII